MVSEMKLTILRIENRTVSCQLDNDQSLILPGDGLLRIYKKVIQ